MRRGSGITPVGQGDAPSKDAWEVGEQVAMETLSKSEMIDPELYC